MSHDAINQRTLSRALARMAIPVALSLAPMAFLFTGGCTVREAPPNDNRRRIDVKVKVDVERRPVCPDGQCHFRSGILDSGLRHKCMLAKNLPLSPGEGRGEGGQPSGTADKRERLTLPAALALTFFQKEREAAMNLPLAARCRNYGGGSCVCASTISLLRWQGRDDLAAALRGACLGGQSTASLHTHLDRLGVRYASTTSGDEAFLEWCIRTRRGCGLTYFPGHYVNLVDLTSDRAMLLDNNHVEQYLSIPRDEFLRRWRAYGGWATAVVYSPAAPIARR